MMILQVIVQLSQACRKLLKFLCWEQQNFSFHAMLQAVEMVELDVDLHHYHKVCFVQCLCCFP